MPFPLVSLSAEILSATRLSWTLLSAFILKHQTIHENTASFNLLRPVNVRVVFNEVNKLGNE